MYLKSTAIFLLFIIGCKSADNDPEYYPVNDFIESHFYYKAGSYWVFSDSVTQEESIIRVSASRSGEDYINYGDRQQHPIRVEKFSSNGYWMHPPLSGLDSAHIMFDLRGDYCQLMYVNPFFPQKQFSSVLFTVPQLTDTIVSSTVYYSVEDAMAVNGKTYSQVYHLRNTDPAKFDDEYWVTKNEGIIKAHIRHPEENNLDRVYELKTFNIVR